MPAIYLSVPGVSETTCTGNVINSGHENEGNKTPERCRTFLSKKAKHSMIDQKLVSSRIIVARFKLNVRNVSNSVLCPNRRRGHRVYRGLLLSMKYNNEGIRETRCYHLHG
jgi:hypothetical protein